MFGGRFSVLTDSLTASDSLKFQFATDGEGNYGYLGADDSFIPFKGGATVHLLGTINTTTNFDISDIVGSKNVGKYSAKNFLVVISSISASKTKGYSSSGSETTASCTISASSTLGTNISYDTTGKVTATPYTGTISTYLKNNYSANDSFIATCNVYFIDNLK